MRHLVSSSWPAFAIALSSVGLACAAPAAEDHICTVAAEHVAACLGAPAERGGACDIAAAEQLAAMSCAEVAATASETKADADGFLCRYVSEWFCPCAGIDPAVVSDGSVLVALDDLVLRREPQNPLYNADLSVIARVAAGDSVTVSQVRDVHDANGTWRWAEVTSISTFATGWTLLGGTGAPSCSVETGAPRVEL
jgi:hypothetical protein